MSGAHRKKKNPELVRLHLLESARRLAMENGLGAVSIEAVAADAGVTKGGLFHHFPSKQALIDAVFQHLLQEFEENLRSRIATDPESAGRFTRAYVCSVFEDGAEAQWGGPLDGDTDRSNAAPGMGSLVQCARHPIGRDVRAP